MITILVTAVAIAVGVWAYREYRGRTTTTEPRVVESKNPRQVAGIRAGDDLNDVFYLPDKDIFYVASFDENKIYFVNAGNSSIGGNVTIESPNRMLRDTQRNMLYVSSGENTLMKVTADTFEPKGQVTVGTRPSQMALDKAGRQLFVVNEFSNNVSVINPETFTLITTIQVGEKPLDVVIGRSGDFAYVSNERDSSISVISVENLTVVNTIFDVGRPVRLMPFPIDDLILILDYFNDQLLVLQEKDGKVIKKINVVTSPVGMALDLPHKKLYVASFTANSVGIVDLDKEQMTEVISLGSAFSNAAGLNNVALNGNGSEAVLTNTNTGEVYFIGL